MKRAAFSILAIALLMTLVCGSAFAMKGDITVKSAKAYADPDFEFYIGTIPKNTSVMVRAYGSYADIIVNGIECYVKPSTLTQGKNDANYIGTATLKKGADVYQRPTSSSRKLTNDKKRKVYVYSVSKGFALVRTGKGVYGFVKADSLNDMKAK